MPSSAHLALVRSLDPTSDGLARALLQYARNRGNSCLEPPVVVVNDFEVLTGKDAMATKFR